MTQPPTLDTNHDGKVTASEASRWASHWAFHIAGSLVTAYLAAAHYGLVPMPDAAPAWTPCPVVQPSPVAVPPDTDAPTPAPADTDAPKASSAATAG